MKVSFNCKLNANRHIKSIYYRFHKRTYTIIDFYVLPSIHTHFFVCEQTGTIDVQIDIEWLLWGVYLSFDNYSYDVPQKVTRPNNDQE